MAETIEVVVYPRLVPLKSLSLPRRDFFGIPGAESPVAGPRLHPRHKRLPARAAREIHPLESDRPSPQAAGEDFRAVGAGKDAARRRCRPIRAARSGRGIRTHAGDGGIRGCAARRARLRRGTGHKRQDDGRRSIHRVRYEKPASAHHPARGARQGADGTGPGSHRHVSPSPESAVGGQLSVLCPRKRRDGADGQGIFHAATGALPVFCRPSLFRFQQRPALPAVRQPGDPIMTVPGRGLTDGCSQGDALVSRERGNGTELVLGLGHVLFASNT